MRKNKGQSLGEILLSQGKITQEQWEKVEALHKERRERYDHLLLQLGYCAEEDILNALSLKLGIPFLTKLDGGDLDEGVLSQIPLHFARKHKVVPLRKKGNVLTVAVKDPLDLHPLDDIRLLCGYRVKPVICRGEEILRAIDRYYHLEANGAQEMLRDLSENGRKSSASEVEKVEDLLDLANKAPIIKLVNLIIFQALEKRASDIHIEPFEKELRVRFRIDGILYDMLTPPKDYQAAIISRIKIMAHLNIAERRLPQDGRIKIKKSGKEIDIRVSVIPTSFGERVVLRLLDKSNLLSLEKLGLSGDRLKLVDELIHRPYGIILVTGPTGSGKTTTLYAAISKLNSPQKNIITVEDPIEYQLEGVGQMQVNPKINLTFANGLRSILRQDPDILMVGEIRDLETAEIAVRASLTGHLVFSTLHTNDAAGAITRLLDIGIEPYLVSSSVIAVIAQRLVRLICPYCKEPYVPEERELDKIGLKIKDVPGGTLYKGRGCPGCLNTGYRGRTGIFELLTIDEDIRGLILARTETGMVKKKAVERGMKTLRMDGADKVKSGLTTIPEVIRVTQEDLFEPL